MSALPDLASEFQQTVAELGSKYAIPGVVAAAWQDGELIEAASGVTNLDTQVEMTTDTVFLIGSITKVWTSTLVMTFVEDGTVTLDEPVRTYLPDLRLADESVAASVTLRQLLTHTSGIEGDHFIDYGRGDDAVAKYVDGAGKFTQLYQPGELYSYCNSGFIIAGRALEVLTGKPFHQLMSERIIGPLGLRQTVQLPEEAILHRAAVGHRRKADGFLEVWPQWNYPRSMDPAGTSLCSTASELIGFGRLHLDGGTAADGTRLLTAASIAELQRVHAEIPYVGYGDQGLGWMLLHGYGTPCIGHGGGSPGGLDWLYVFPERNLAVSFFANYDPGGSAAAFGKDLLAWLLPRLGLEVPPTATYAGPKPIDFARYAGTYKHADMVFEIEAKPDHVTLASSGRGHVAPFEPYSYPPFMLRPLDETTFFAAASIDDPEDVGRFRFLLQDADGRPRILHNGLRAFRRIDG